MNRAEVLDDEIMQKMMTAALAVFFAVFVVLVFLGVFLHHLLSSCP